MSGNDWFNLNSIVDLQKALINDLSGNSSSGNDLSSSSQLAINSVAGNLASLSETISGSSVLPTLTYQNEVNEILERENTRLITRKKEIDVAEMGQKRMVDLTTNSTLRNKALNKMYVVITIAVLMYLGIRLLINSEKVPEKVTDIMFIFLVTGTIILLINMYYDYERRNNMDYNIIDLGDPSQIGANSSSASTNLLESRFNGCVKEACCPEEANTTINSQFVFPIYRRMMVLPNPSSNTLLHQRAGKTLPYVGQHKNICLTIWLAQAIRLRDLQP
jgi:hypothetical protein